MAESKKRQRVVFPADIREDAALMGIRFSDVMKYILPALILGVILALPPFPVLLRLLFFFGLPLGAAVWVGADVPGAIRKRKRFKKEPDTYHFIPPDATKNDTATMKDLVAVKSFHGPFLEFKDNSMAIVLKIDSPPWLTLGVQASDEVALEGFRMALRSIYMNNAEVLMTQDVDRHQLRSEWNRQEQTYQKMFQESPALKYALDRVKHHRSNNQARGEYCHLRIRLHPDWVESEELPNSPEERKETLARILTDTTESVIFTLARYGVTANVQGPESIRDLATRQMNPISWQQKPPPDDTEWDKLAEENMNYDEMEDEHSHKNLQKLYNKMLKFMPNKERKKIRVARGEKPKTVIALGNRQIEDWFNTTFENYLSITTASTPDDFKLAIENDYIDIAVVMRHSNIGGISEADELALWAIEKTQSVLFIAGELDDSVLEMVEKVKAAGGYVLSCPPGETINGDELVFLLQSILRKLEENDPKEVPRDNDKTPEEGAKQQQQVRLETLKKGAAQLSSLLKQSTGKTPGLISRLKKQLDELTDEGTPFEEEEPQHEAIYVSGKNPTAITAGGLFAVVSPWRPGLAGRVAAAAAKMFGEGEEEVAVIGANGQSTIAVWLDIPDEELMMSDWRVPGSQVPVMKDNLKIWAVDPAKALDIKIDEELWQRVKEARRTAAYTVVDFAGDFQAVQKAAFQGRAVILVIIPGGDPIEQRTSLLWLNRFMEGKQNIITGIDLRGVPPTTPQAFKPKVVVRNNPADALKMVLQKTGNEFIWN